VALSVVATRPVKTAAAAPAPVNRADVVLNHAILLAEILGVDATDALATINAVHDRPTELPQIFDRPDQEVMIAFLSELLDALEEAADSAGRPLDTGSGRALAGSEHMRTDQDGSLAVYSHSFHLADLRKALAQILAAFHHAYEHNFLVRND
jgi:hypothetical protein